MDHFKCDKEGCGYSFVDEHDSCYDHGGKVYCLLHYVNEYAQRCTGCSLPVLESYFGLNDEISHPECYSIRTKYVVETASLVLIQLKLVEGHWVDNTGAIVSKEKFELLSVKAMEDIIFIDAALQGFIDSMQGALSEIVFSVKTKNRDELIESCKTGLRCVSVLLRAINIVGRNGEPQQLL